MKNGLKRTTEGRSVSVSLLMKSVKSYSYSFRTGTVAKAEECAKKTYFHLKIDVLKALLSSKKNCDVLIVGGEIVV